MQLQASNETKTAQVVVKLFGKDISDWNDLVETTGYSGSKLLGAIANQVFEPEFEDGLRELLTSDSSSDEDGKSVATTMLSADADKIVARIKELGGSGRSRGKVLTYIMRKAFEEFLAE